MHLSVNQAPGGLCDAVLLIFLEVKQKLEEEENRHVIRKKLY